MTSEAEFLRSIAGFVAFWYAIAIVANGVFAVYWWRLRRRASAAAWLVPGLVYVPPTLIAFTGDPQRMQWIMFSPAVRAWADQVLGPTVFLVGSTAALAVLYRWRRVFTSPGVAWSALNASWLGFGFALTDADFCAVVAKPDNVPIVGLVFLLGFFTWLSARKSVMNDARLARGDVPQEAEDNDQVLVWPDLVYIELICMVALTVVLIAWSLLLRAPLEAEASTVVTPNPSKAPWYFLGLQEMLLYFDPWMAGVVLPCLIIFGLCAIPYLDPNREGSGYYTIDQRRFAYLAFQFGFLVLWILPMLIGTFFRGPNWSFFGLFETWDVHKVEALNNVQLSERFWIDLLGRPLPGAASGSGGARQLLTIVWRELPGLLLLSVYFLAVPRWLSRSTSTFGALRAEMGRARYAILMFLLLMMVLVPIKMVCRWSFNMNYFVAIPEYAFNF